MVYYTTVRGANAWVWYMLQKLRPVRVHEDQAQLWGPSIYFFRNDAHTWKRRYFQLTNAAHATWTDRLALTVSINCNKPVPCRPNLKMPGSILALSSS